MYACPEKKLAFLAHPRTASVSTAEALCSLPGWKRVGHPKGHHEGFYGNDRESWIVFSTVRNPWDLIVSWVYATNKRIEIPLPILPIMISTAAERNRWIKNNRLFWHVDDSDIVLRFEDLKGAGKLRVNELQVELPHRNASPRNGRSYQDFYTPQTRDHIGDLFAEEINYHGYEF